MFARWMVSIHRPLGYEPSALPLRYTADTGRHSFVYKSCIFRCTSAVKSVVPSDWKPPRSSIQLVGATVMNNWRYFS